MEVGVRLLRFILIEARDWLFAIAAFVAVTWTTVVVQDWFVAVAVTMGFVVLYLLSLFATSRWIRGRASME